MLKNYALVICELGGQRSNSLDVRAVIDLSSGTIPANSHYAIVTNIPTLQSTVPTFPNRDVWRIFGSQMNGNNWLTVKEENVVAIFLLYNNGENLFQLFTKVDRYLKLDGEKLQFVRNSLLDYVVIKHAKGPDTCPVIKEVLSDLTGPFKTILYHYLPEHKPKPKSGFYSLSINRCGNEQMFDIRAYKHGLK